MHSHDKLSSTQYIRVLLLQGAPCATTQQLADLDALVRRSGHQLLQVAADGDCGCHAVLKQLVNVDTARGWDPHALRALLAMHMARALQVNDVLCASVLGSGWQGSEEQQAARLHAYLQGVRNNAWLTYTDFSVMGTTLAQGLQRSVQITVYNPGAGVQPFTTAHPAAGPCGAQLHVRVANTPASWDSYAPAGQQWPLTHWMAVVPSTTRVPTHAAGAQPPHACLWRSTPAPLQPPQLP